MKAIYLPVKGGAESLVFGELPIPAPQPGEVLVRVHAAAVTPSELGWLPTFQARSGAARSFPVIPGHEFSGVIAGINGEVGDLMVGDEVFGLNDWYSNGAQAQYCTAPAAFVAPKPSAVDHAIAAAAPISALTAWQAVVVRARLGHGQTILIHGAAGAVGLFAVQIAREVGAQVIATAAAEDHAVLRSLGAEVLIDYRNQRFEDYVRDVDVVFDTVGGETLARSWSVLRPDGTVVTIATSSAASNNSRTRDAFMLVEADRAQLAALGQAIDFGKRRVFVAGRHPLAQARQAYAQPAHRAGYGKHVISIVQEPRHTEIRD